ncbi:MAG: hypothetical protein ABFD50_18800 [Smithella sp.]
MKALFSKVSLRNIRIVLTLCAMGILFPFFFSAYTSPLYPGFHGADSAIFMTMGRAVVEGKTLYTDIFDIKGPMIFFINALGQWIYNGRLGTFLIQTIFMIFTVFGMYKTARLFVSTVKAFLVVFLSLLVLTATYERGNLTEEYSLAFIFPAIYCSCRYWKEGKKVHPTGFSLVYGLSFGLLTWTRINNAAVIGAIVFYIYLTILFRKRWYEFGRNLLFFLIGVLAVSIPIIFYFWIKGALSEMLYGTFVFLFSYAQNGIMTRPGWKWAWTLKNVSPALGVIFVSVVYSRSINKYLGQMIGLSTLLTAVALLFGMNYLHYYMILTPVFLTALSMTFEIWTYWYRERKISWLLPLLAGLGIAFVLYVNYQPVKSYIRKMYYDRTKPIYLEEVKKYLEQAEMIPEADRDSVWGFNINPSWYYVVDILPSFKYFINQGQQIMIDPDMEQEIVDMLDVNPPKWIAASVGAADSFEELSDLLDREYKMVSDSANIQLFQHIIE